jgi:peptidyl-prolyl cis-trans isomerase B (cyclophilin B)
VNRRNRTLLLVVLALVLFGGMVGASGCSKASQTPKPAEKTGSSDSGTSSEQQTSTETQPPTGQEGSVYTPTYVPNGNETAILTTNKGKIVVKLFGKEAPIHVGNFIELVKKGFYDGTKFHRYEPGFVIQGGDPQTKELSASQVTEAGQSGNPPLGTGGPGYTIKGEFDPAVNSHKHLRGALGMARTNMPDTAGSQFYFALQALPSLDGQYTVFGQITEGLDVMDQLRVGDTIEKIEITGAN